MAKSIEKMNAQELEAEITKLATQREALRLKQSALQAALSKKLTQDSALRKLSQITDAEKQALAQALAAEGIQSGEEFGKL